jgi:hypothetical protein
MEFKRAIIVACKPKPHYHVWIRFDDGLEGEVDLSDLVDEGVFAAWKSVDFFNQVRVDPKKRFSSPRARIARCTSLPTLANCSASERVNHLPAARV